MKGWQKMKRKSIVLSGVNGENKKAVLSLEETGAEICGTVRLYNFEEELQGVSSLGFYFNNAVKKSGLTYKSKMLYTFFLDVKQIPNEFSCALVNFQNAEAKPILYGASDGKDDDIYATIISELRDEHTLSKTQSVLDNYGVDFEKNEKEEIEKEIDKFCHEDPSQCEHCVYKEFFYENSQNQEKTLSLQKTEKISEEIEEKVKKDIIFEENDNENEKGVEKEPNFIERLKPQIDELFKKNPLEERLQKIIPSSKWVKVDYEDDGDFYVFGLLYDESENVKYVCYGVPAIFEETPPKELSGYPIWLPLDEKDGFGYWLVYQDAETGEPVKAIVE